MVSQPLNLYEQDHPKQRVKRSEMIVDAGWWTGFICGFIAYSSVIGILNLTLIYFILKCETRKEVV